VVASIPAYRLQRHCDQCLHVTISLVNKVVCVC